MGVGQHLRDRAKHFAKKVQRVAIRTKEESIIIVKDVARITKASATLLVAIRKNTVPVYVQLAVPLGIIFGIGLALVMLRTLIIMSAPAVAHHAKLFAAWATTIQDILAIIKDIVAGIIFVVQLITDAISMNGQTPNAPKFTIPGQVTADMVNDFTQMLIECGNQTTHDSLTFITQASANNAVCPVLRAAAPLRWVNTTILPHFNWLAFDYAPYPGRDNPPPGQYQHVSNCDFPDRDVMKQNELCAALRLGNIVVEIGLPTALGVILIATVAGNLASLLVALLESVWTIATIAAALLVIILEVV